jgi:hypothetical protein
MYQSLAQGSFPLPSCKEIWRWEIPLLEKYLNVSYNLILFCQWGSWRSLCDFGSRKTWMKRMPTARKKRTGSRAGSPHPKSIAESYVFSVPVRKGTYPFRILHEQDKRETGQTPDNRDAMNLLMATRPAVGTSRSRRKLPG